MSTQSRLDTMRQSQSIEELKRKAKKAVCLKSKLWTQEEIDLSMVEGRKLFFQLGWDKDVNQKPIK